MYATEIKPGMHLHGTLVREVDDYLIETVPVVKRVRRITSAGHLTEIHLGWTIGGRGVYLPTDELAVLP
jgi:hypothetical protein